MFLPLNCFFVNKVEIMIILISILCQALYYKCIILINSFNIYNTLIFTIHDDENVIESSNNLHTQAMWLVSGQE